jgi:hypothetical protein
MPRCLHVSRATRGRAAQHGLAQTPRLGLVLAQTTARPGLMLAQTTAQLGLARAPPTM